MGKPTVFTSVYVRCMLFKTCLQANHMTQRFQLLTSKNDLTVFNEAYISSEGNSSSSWQYG